MKDYARYRKEFPITEKITFMNHAAVSPCPKRVVRAVTSFLKSYSENGINDYPDWMKRVEEVRGLFARLLRADPGEIAFAGNTSDGLSTVASGLDWKSGEGVLVPSPEFPANVYPWMNLEGRGVRVRFIEREEGRIGVRHVEKALKPGTRLLALSSVDFATGCRCDLEALGAFCRQKGLLFCVDAIQSLGVIPMDVNKYGIHFLASGGHKWLLATMGCGCLFISNEA
ncbi:MAG: aminotransferase class V-fold PLP-dependent enzyme, partial [Pseudomonadota bacterium]